ncbi:MAG: dTMP kinase [Candidatus Omnitrophica bacterium]|nr:dTMP kinase [Candidatus Omnitrophota bacterium]
MKQGILITLEGNEGSGKSTQIRLLHSFLKKKGVKVFLTREPGGTRVGDAIRGVLLDKKNKKMSAFCETLLYMASRAQLVEEVIAPKLRQGVVVLCDRWLDATVAYQGYGGGVNVEWIRRIGRQATLGLKPALSLYLDLPVEAGLRRARKRKAADRIESKKSRFHQKVRQGYLAIARQDRGRFKRIAVSEKDSIAAVHERVKESALRVL